MANINLKDILNYFNRHNNLLIVIFFLPIILTLVVFFFQDDDEISHLGMADYQRNPNLVSRNQNKCQANSRPGDVGSTYGEASKEGIKYNVHTPQNYNPTYAHPLIMVYAPAGANRSKSEKMTGLTYSATSAGFVITYADHPELSTTTTVELGTIPGLIEKKWCIDDQRIYLTGHSDGGTASMALAFMSGTKHIPSAIAPSAAGINDQGLKGHSCPGPLPVMVMHSAKDRLFPGYGIESSSWWAACNNCDPIPDKLDNGCIVYSGCDKGVETWYCEGNKSHSKWPGLNKEIIQFFTALAKK